MDDPARARAPIRSLSRNPSMRGGGAASPPHGWAVSHGLARPWRWIPEGYRRPRFRYTRPLAPCRLNACVSSEPALSCSASVTAGAWYGPEHLLLERRALDVTKSDPEHVLVTRKPAFFLQSTYAVFLQSTYAVCIGALDFPCHKVPEHVLVLWTRALDSSQALPHGAYAHAEDNPQRYTLALLLFESVTPTG